MDEASGDTVHVERFALAIGRAVIDAWGALPRDIQERLFERAVVSGHAGERDESLREQLAVFLHGNHPRMSAERDAPSDAH